MASPDLGRWMVLWTLTAVIIIVGRGRNSFIGVGLVAAFVVGSTVGYWLAGAIYLLPWYASGHDPGVVALGLRESTYAMIAFGVGCLFVAPRLVSMSPVRGPLLRVPIPRLARVYISIGLMCFLLLVPTLGRVPTAGALVGQGWDLMIAGICLACWYAWRKGNPGEFTWWVLLTLSLPLLTVVTGGFLAAGTSAAIAVLTFLASVYRPRWRTALISLVLVYAALSLYVTYMRDRTDIREVVWGGQPIAARLQRVYLTVSTFEWFDIHNTEHLDRIDARLDLAYQAGAAVQNLESGLVPFAHGETLWDGIIGLVPRAIWPTKPIVAGGGDLVGKYTGAQFAEGTSVGIGGVMESYINFGRFGVVLVHVLLGSLVGAIDTAAGVRLRSGNWPGFVRWFLPGLTLVAVGGAFLETTTSAAGAVLAAFLVNRLVTRTGPSATPMPTRARASRAVPQRRPTLSH